jgi:uncharacterized protein (TIGR02001 family)
MKLFGTAAAAALALGLTGLAAPASAQDAKVAFNVGVTSDYAGAWASNVDFGDDTDAEVDVYGGYRTEAAGFALDFGVIGYLYAGEPDGADYNYAEFKAAASRAVGPATFGAAVYYSPDFFGAADKEATYAEVNAAFSPADKWTISGAVGQQWLDVSDDYLTWNAGIGYALTENLSADARYYDTDVDGVPVAEDRFVVGLKLTY